MTSSHPNPILYFNTTDVKEPNSIHFSIRTVSSFEAGSKRYLPVFKKKNSLKFSTQLLIHFI